MSELEKVKKNKRKTVQLKREVLEHSQEAERATERLSKVEEDLKTAIEEEDAIEPYSAGCSSSSSSVI